MKSFFRRKRERNLTFLAIILATLRCVPVVASSAIFFFSFFLSLSLHESADNPNDICPATSCQRGGRKIRFPFRLRDVQPDRCGYPGFVLLCNNRSQAILQLPNAQDFVVSLIYYDQQYVVLKDPSSCLAKRLQNQTFSSSLFVAQEYGSFMFADCPDKFLPDFGMSPVDCLSDEHHKVLLCDANDPSALYLPILGCRTWNVSVPVSRQLLMDITERVSPKWDRPDCRSCDERGGWCGLRGSTGSQVGCFSKHGLSKSEAKYTILCAVLAPLLLCMFGIACYLSSRARFSGHPNRPKQPPIGNDGENNVMDISSPSSPPTRTQLTSNGAVGLDSLTIESYPKIQVGNDGRVPRSNDNICAICLSEYQPKETLQTIPKCGHYFRAQCIDQWLGRNASCPMCRNRKGYA